MFVRDDGERGVRACRDFAVGEFVLEFEANLLSEAENHHAEKVYQHEGLPVYTLEVRLIACSANNIYVTS